MTIISPRPPPLGLFDRLPRELRDMIYACCIGSCATAIRHGSISLSADISGVLKPSSGLVRVPTLAQTNKSLCREVLGACNRYTFHEVTTNTKYAALLPRTQFQNATSIDRLCIEHRVVSFSRELFHEHYPGQVCGRQLLDLIPRFPRVTDIALDIEFTGRMHIDERYDVDMCNHVTTVLESITNLQAFSITTNNRFIGIFKVKEDGKWVYKSKDGKPTLRANPSTTYWHSPINLNKHGGMQGNLIRGHPTLYDVDWLRFLQGLGKASSMRDYLQKRQEAADAFHRLDMSTEMKSDLGGIPECERLVGERPYQYAWLDESWFRKQESG